MYNSITAVQNPPIAISKERAEYLSAKKRKNRLIAFFRFAIIVVFIAIWEIFALIGIIDPFLMSQPSRIVTTMLNLSQNNLHIHVAVTLYETLTGFALGVLMGLIIAVMLWWSDTLSRIAEPYLVVLNSLPKIALGPVIIIWMGAGTKAIIFMALAISLVVTVLEMLNGFNQTAEDKILMARTFGASKMQVFTKIVLPSNLVTLFASLKINIGLSLVGVIAGEFLVSKAGLGYLIVYGGQVFKLDLVMTSVIILAIMAALMYRCVIFAEKTVLKKMYK